MTTPTPRMITRQRATSDPVLEEEHQQEEENPDNPGREEDILNEELNEIPEELTEVEEQTLPPPDRGSSIEQLLQYLAMRDAQEHRQRALEREEQRIREERRLETERQQRIFEREEQRIQRELERQEREAQLVLNNRRAQLTL